MEILYSETGSTGNCSVIKNSVGNIIIIDAGLKYNYINKKVGYLLPQAVALLVTHCHSDHTAHISDFSKQGINLYLNKETQAKTQIFCPTERIITTAPLYIEKFAIVPFELVHNSVITVDEKKEVVPCENYGFLIADTKSGEKMLWITDTMYVLQKFPSVEYICIECNYEKVSDYSLYDMSSEKFVESRRLKSHMSFETCLNFIKAQDLSKTKTIKLLHLSKHSLISTNNELISKIKKEIPTEIEVII